MLQKVTLERVSLSHRYYQYAIFKAIMCLFISSFDLLFLLPILVVRLIVKGQIVHEEKVYMHDRLPTMRHMRAIAKM